MSGLLPSTSVGARCPLAPGGDQSRRPAGHGAGGSWQRVFHPAGLEAPLRQRHGKG